MIRRIYICLAGFILAGAVQAQEDLAQKYGALSGQCYEEADGEEAKLQCIGASATLCMEEEEGGYSTLGMSQCTHSETIVWDQILNAEYKLTMSFAKEMDTEDKHLFPEFAQREDHLRKAQRAWIAFRDAECGLSYAWWGAGSARHIAGSNCMMELTARRTIELGVLREMFQ